MARITVRLDDDTREAFRQIANQHNVPMSELARDALHQFAYLYRDDMPEHLAAHVSHEKITSENKWKIRRMTFKSRVRDFLNDQLDKSIPPEPDKVERDYIESIRKEVQEIYSEHNDEYMEFIDNELSRYELLHPSYSDESESLSEEKYRELIDKAATHGKMGRWDLCIEFAEHLEDAGRLPPTYDADKVVRDVRNAVQGTWREDWNSAVWGELDG